MLRHQYHSHGELLLEMRMRFAGSVGDVVGSRIWPDMERTRVPIVNNTTIVELLNKIVLLSIFCS